MEIIVATVRPRFNEAASMERLPDDTPQAEEAPAVSVKEPVLVNDEAPVAVRFTVLPD
jgi:hypothetical protein